MIITLSRIQYPFKQCYSLHIYIPWEIKLRCSSARRNNLYYTEQPEVINHVITHTHLFSRFMDHHHSRFTSRHLLVAVHLSHYMCPFSVRGNSLAGVREDTRTDSRSGCHSTTSWFRAESAGFTSLLADDLPPKFFLYVHFCISVRLWTLGLSLDKVYNANLHIRWWKKIAKLGVRKGCPRTHKKNIPRRQLTSGFLRARVR